MDTRARWTAIGIAGVAMALLGNLPLVNFFNCILCMWVWLGGALAVILYRRAQPGQALTAGQGAGLGALAGLVGALVGFVVYYLTASVSAPLMDGLAKALNINLPTPISAQDPSSAIGGALFFLAVDLILYPGFGALGGLIAANMNAPKVVDPTAPKP